MGKSVGHLFQPLTAMAAVIAALGLGFSAARASADPGDPVEQVRRTHEEMHAHGMGMDMDHRNTTEMDQLHAQMSSRLSAEDRAVHDRMHEACGD